jgi:hypothetical protein
LIVIFHGIIGQLCCYCIRCLPPVRVAGWQVVPKN